MTQVNYYEREAATHLDGSPIFASQADESTQAQVARELERHWTCSLHSFGRLAPVDWYALRLDRIVALVELKARTHDSARYPTVFLNVRKWLALTLGAAGLGVPAVFVVKFTDEIRWVNVAAVDASRVTMGGCSRHVKSRSDVEPVIEVLIEKMDRLGAGT